MIQGREIAYLETLYLKMHIFIKRTKNEQNKWFKKWFNC
jgi:hypothetical protein